MEPQYIRVLLGDKTTCKGCHCIAQFLYFAELFGCPLFPPIETEVKPRQEEKGRLQSHSVT